MIITLNSQRTHYYTWFSEYIITLGPASSSNIITPEPETALLDSVRWEFYKSMLFEYINILSFLRSLFYEVPHEDYYIGLSLSLFPSLSADFYIELYKDIITLGSLGALYHWHSCINYPWFLVNNATPRSLRTLLHWGPWERYYTEVPENIITLGSSGTLLT